MDYTDAEGTVSVSDGDVTLVRYRARTDASKPHLDRVALAAGSEDAPRGRNLVATSPHDHPWHHGCWFVQKVVDGINCWESERDTEHGRLHGHARNLSYEVDGSPAGDATPSETVAIHQDVRWQTSDGDQLLDDRRELTVFDPDGVTNVGHGGYLLTWRQTLTAAGSRRYLSSETYHGRYGGLSLRLARDLTGGEIRLPDATDPDPNEDTPAPWCDFTGSLDGRRRLDPWKGGITVLTHPETGDTDWFTRSQPFPLLCANPVWRRVVTLDPGESVSWEWGLWVHPGRPSRDAIEAVSARYRDLASDEGW